jgi:queuine tRNA-ribosyltransferase
MANHFEIVDRSTVSKARTGKLKTPHGILETPVFAPVASQASVKALAPDELENIGISLLLSNSYHLYLRPGIETINSLVDYTSS